MHVNFLIYLRDTAQQWYSDELSKQDKIVLKIDINQWYTALAECFYENLMIAIKKLNEIQYNWQNVCNSVSSDSYIA